MIAIIDSSADQDLQDWGAPGHSLGPTCMCRCARWAPGPQKREALLPGTSSPPPASTRPRRPRGTDPRTSDRHRIHVTPLFSANFTEEGKNTPQPGNRSLPAVSPTPHVALDYPTKEHSCGLSSSFPLGLQTGAARPRGNYSPAEPFFKGDFFGQEKGMSDAVAE